MTSGANGKMLQAYDNALLGILQNEAGLERFLDVIFGFLSRRTDFYHVMTEPKQKYGFPPGVAEKMTLGYFRKYQKMTEAVQARTAEQKKIEPQQKDAEENKSSISEVQQASEKPVQPKKSEAAASSINEPTKEQSTSKSSEASSEDPKPVEFDQTTFQSNPDSYNGAACDKYSWSQNYDDVDVKVPVEKSVMRGKQVKVDIQRKHLKVSIQATRDSEFVTIIDHDLQHEINKEESMWSLEGGKNISITLTKDKSVWWTMLLEGDKEIDIQKISPERSMGDMDEEERAVINKLQFDEKQKRLGLPQSHEMKVHEMLKKGWDAEGSPFQGQDFDPKMFNISPGAVGQ